MTAEQNYIIIYVFFLFCRLNKIYNTRDCTKRKARHFTVDDNCRENFKWLWGGFKAAFTPDEQLVSGYIACMFNTDTCCRLQVASSGYMLTASRRHNYTIHLCHGRLVSFVSSETDGRQTGENFVADTRNISGKYPANMCPGVNAA